MSEYTELKRLAINCRTECCADEDEQARNERDFLLEVDPEEILALIAENDRLIESDQEATELCDTLSALLGKVAVSVRGPEEPKSRHGFHDLPSRVKTVVAERDQLKAENERLRNAAVKVIEMNRQHAEDQYGDSDKAESWSCVTVLRSALVHGEQS